MTDQPSTERTPERVIVQGGTEPAKQPSKFKIFIGWEKRPDGYPPFIWAERWNSFIIMLFVAIGVPLLGMSGFTTQSKLWVAVFWFAFGMTLFAHFERREIVGQMQGRGSLDAEQAAIQQDSAQNPYWGVVIALIVWLLALAIYVTLQVKGLDVPMERLIFVEVPAAIWRGTSESFVRYGFLEWFILAHTWVMTTLCNNLTYNEINQFNQATPRAQRSERRVP